MAQLARASALGAEGRGFESHQPDHKRTSVLHWFFCGFGMILGREGREKEPSERGSECSANAFLRSKKESHQPNLISLYFFFAVQTSLLPHLNLFLKKQAT